MRKALDEGKGLGMPDGVLINGKGPYQYNTTLVPDGILHETLNVQPGNSMIVFLKTIENGLLILFFCNFQGKPTVFGYTMWGFPQVLISEFRITICY